MEEFTKQSYEAYPVALDFYGKLPPFSSLALVSGTVSAIDESDNSDATSIILQSATLTIQNKLAMFFVQSGANGKSYKITAKVICNDGSKFEEDVRMLVVDV